MIWVGQFRQLAAAVEIHIGCISIDPVAHAAAFVLHTEVLNLVSVLLQCLTQFEYIRLTSAVSMQKFPLLRISSAKYNMSV